MITVTLERVYRLPLSRPSGAGTDSPSTPDNLPGRPNTTNHWYCEICGRQHAPEVRWHKVRFRNRARLPASDAFAARKFYRLCTECLQSFVVCGRCGHWHATSNSTQVKYKVGRRAAACGAMCETCFSQVAFSCSDCLTVHPIDQLADRSDGRRVCRACWNRRVPCSACGHRVVRSSAPANRPVLCETCFAAAYPTIQRYGFKPAPLFGTHDSDTPTGSCDPSALYLGVELEIDDGREPVDLLAALAGLTKVLYYKHDGSLSEQGIEIVSHPLTLAAHQKGTLIPWSLVHDACRQRGYRSYDASHSCGLHVHMNRSFFDRRYRTTPMDKLKCSKATSPSLAKLLGFVYGHADLFTALAQRVSDQYAPITKCKSVRDLIGLRDMVRLGKPIAAHRYSALNFANDATIEWRLFRGTLNTKTFLATLELVDASSRFVMATKMRELVDVASSWIQFCRYIRTNEARYPHLKEYMVSRSVWSV